MDNRRVHTHKYWWAYALPAIGIFLVSLGIVGSNVWIGLRIIGWIALLWSGFWLVAAVILNHER